MQERGLSTEEVQKRVASGQVNNTGDVQSRSYLEILSKNVMTPFNMVLIILGIGLLIVDGWLNAIATVGVLIFNVLISTTQEVRAKRRLDAIAVLMRPKVTVIRNGEEVVIDRAEVVIDDIVHMRSGDQAQVDGVILEEKSLEMDESLLTGESSTRKKHREDRIFSGSYCVTGDCWFKVDKVGNDTYSSKMLSSAKKFHKKKTPLQIETNIITELLMAIAVLFIFFLVVLSLILQSDMKTFLRQLAIVLDIVPIALFLLITLTYMIAAVRMADSGVLLQNSSSVESMSHVDTVCMDKTGTITTNNLIFNDITYYGDQAKTDLMIGEFVSTTGSKNRTITAMEVKFGTARAELLDEVQFSSDRKYSAVRIQGGDGIHTIVMGAWPFLKHKVSNPEGVEEKLKELSSQGLRSVVFFDAGSAELHQGDEIVLPDLTMLAVISIMDEVRPDCKEIITQFLDNGLDIKVISGDDPETVDAIFALAGIPGERKIISGDTLAKLEGAEYEKAVLETNIFGRMKPEQKENVIETLRLKGRYVAMVGDGINDVRSIKKAQVGVAVQSGSGAARGVADMILANDDFKTLPKAIVEGKRTVSGMRDILRLYLSRNFTLSILVFVLLLLCHEVPLQPIQNTVYAFVTVSISATLLTIWAKPRDNKEDLILPNVLRYVLPTATTIAAFALIIYGFYFTNAFDVLDSLRPFYDDLAADLGYLNFEDMNDKLDLGESYKLVVARSAMLTFLMFAGILQLLILFPPVKKYHIDGETAPVQKKPLILMGLLLLAVIGIYMIPDLCVKFCLILTPDWEMWLIVIGVTVLWFFATEFAIRSKTLKSLNDFGNALVRKYLQRLFEKETAKESRMVQETKEDEEEFGLWSNFVPDVIRDNIKRK